MLFSRRKRIKFLGRAGILYFYEGVEYLVDSEMLDGRNYDIAVFNTVKRNDTKECVTEVQKGQVLKSLIDYLKSKNYRVEIFPKP